MAWSRTELSSTLRGYLTADKPLLVGLGTNALQGRSTTTVQWRSTGSWAAGTDIGDSSYPTTRLWDGYIHNLVSKPTSASTTRYLCFDLGAGSATFDSCILVGNNPENDGAGGGSWAVVLQVADDNAYTTNLTDVETWNAAGWTEGQRLVSYNLDHSGSSSYSYTARYARLKFTGIDWEPELSEVILGQRLQLPCKPNDPWDPDAQRTSGISFSSPSRVRTFHPQAQGQQLVDAEFTLPSDYIDDVQTFWQTSVDRGRYGWIWAPDPSTYPAKSYLMRYPEGAAELGLPYDGPVSREWHLEGEEIPTFVSDEA